jgi:hypothetical protein
VLGMTQLPRPDLGPGYWLDAGGQQVHLMESDTQPPAANHFAFESTTSMPPSPTCRSRASRCTASQSLQAPGARPSCTIRSATYSS